MAGLGYVLSDRELYILTEANESEKRDFVHFFLSDDEQRMYSNVDDLVCSALIAEISASDHKRFDSSLPEDHDNKWSSTSSTVTGIGRKGERHFGDKTFGLAGR